jgi:hypothetical protein
MAQLLQSTSFALFAGVVTGYGIGSSVTSRRLRGGTVQMAAAPPADAVSMQVRLTL